MKVNGIDIRKYDAKQLKADLQPPSLSVNYEWMEGALMPTEFETPVQMGHLKLSVYFKGKNRNSIIRTISEFMANFTKACDMELDGYKGKYKGFITADSCQKMKVKNRYILNLEFDGFLYDDEIEIIFDGKLSGKHYMVGTRETPCIVEVNAKENLDDYVISGFGRNEIIVEHAAAGETIVIDGMTGIVTSGETSAFDRVDLWEFPVLRTGETSLSFSSASACVKVRYKPMWI